MKICNQMCCAIAMRHSCSSLSLTLSIPFGKCTLWFSLPRFVSHRTSLSHRLSPSPICLPASLICQNYEACFSQNSSYCSLSGCEALFWLATSHFHPQITRIVLLGRDRANAIQSNTLIAASHSTQRLWFSSTLTHNKRDYKHSSKHKEWMRMNKPAAQR